MKMTYKRIMYTLLLIASIVISVVIKNKEGFYYSGLIVLVPMCLIFILRLLIPQFLSRDEKSYKFELLTKREKYGAVLNLALLLIWFLVELNCLFRFIG